MSTTAPSNTEAFWSIDLRIQPSTYVYTQEIRTRIASLLALWFSLEWILKVEKTNPTFYREISEKIEWLRKLGFPDPVKMITIYPATLGYNVEENIVPKIEWLRKLGFPDPVKMITIYPATLGYNIKENIVPKIEWLRKLGFPDPVKMITIYPAILSYNIKENIVPKIHMVDHFISEKEIWRSLIASAPQLLWSKQQKHWIILRGLYTLDMLNDETVTRYKQLNTSEIESYILSILQIQNDWEFSTLSAKLKVKKLLSTIRKEGQDWTKLSRRERILTKFSTTKIGKKYATTYPKPLRK